MSTLSLSRRRFLAAGTGAALGLAPGRGSARPSLRLLVGSMAGSVPDVVARRIAERLADAGRGVLVDNRPGAAGRLAINELRQAGPEGATLLLAPGAVATMYPAIYTQPGYDARADLRPVSTAAELTLAMAIGPAVPASVNSVRDFVAWTRSPGAQASFGSPGIGTPPHVLSTLFAQRAGVSWSHVPYTGGPPAVNDLLGGRLSATVLPEGLLRPHAAQGTLRLLATSGAERSPFTAQVPTFAEQGFQDVVMGEWFGFFAPAGTPDAVIESLADDIQRACAAPALATAFTAMAIRPHAGTAAQMAERIAREARVWQPLIRAARITIDS